MLFRESPVIVRFVLPPGAGTVSWRWMIVSTSLPPDRGTPSIATSWLNAWEPDPKKFAGIGEPPKSWKDSPLAGVSNSSFPARIGNPVCAALLFPVVTNKPTSSAIPITNAMPSMTGFV
jgi:hypothetical protein